MGAKVKEPILHLFGEFAGKDLRHLESEAAGYDAKPKTGAFSGDELVAVYNYGSYDGEAIGFLFKDGKVFQFGASHCSCNGLEGMDEMKEVTPEYIRKAIAEKHSSLRARDDYGRANYDANDAFIAALLKAVNKYFPIQSINASLS